MDLFFPENRLEKLREELKVFYSFKINDKGHIVFNTKNYAPHELLKKILAPAEIGKSLREPLPPWLVNLPSQKTLLTVVRCPHPPPQPL